MAIAIAYTSSGGTVYNVTFSDFLGEDLPRSYGAAGSFSNSANGTSILAGPAFAQKYIWGFSVLMTKAEAEAVNNLFLAWDADRAQGRAVAVGLIDETFGGSLTTSATITTPPSYAKAGNFYEVSIGLTQV